MRTWPKAFLYEWAHRYETAGSWKPKKMAIQSIGNPRDSWVQTKQEWYTWSQDLTGRWIKNTQYYWQSRATTQLSYAYANLNNNLNNAATTISTSNYNWSWVVPTQTPIGQVVAATGITVKTIAEVALAELAERASEQLVRDLVGENGFKAWKQLGYIEIESKTRPGIVYRVKHDAVDLYQKKDGNIIDLRQWLCVHPKPLDKGVYPSGDEVATRVLLARFAEDELWNTANLHDRRETGRVLTRQEQLARYRQLASIAA